VVPDRDEDYICPYHASLLDLLSDPTRRRDHFIDPVKCNKTIVDSCMQLITTDSVTDSRAFRYACRYWSHHFHMMLFHAKAACDSESHLCNVVKTFLNQFFWMFKPWVVGCNGPMGVEQARDDLLSACQIVGRVLLMSPCLMFHI